MARKKAVKKETVESPDPRIEAMNTLAGNIWAMQSVSLPLKERLGRIKNALLARSYTDEDLKKLSLPSE